MKEVSTQFIRQEVKYIPAKVESLRQFQIKNPEREIESSFWIFWDIR